MRAVHASDDDPAGPVFKGLLAELQRDGYRKKDRLIQLLFEAWNTYEPDYITAALKIAEQDGYTENSAVIHLFGKLREQLKKWWYAEWARQLKAGKALFRYQWKEFPHAKPGARVYTLHHGMFLLRIAVVQKPAEGTEPWEGSVYLYSGDPREVTFKERVLHAKAKWTDGPEAELAKSAFERLVFIQFGVRLENPKHEEPKQPPVQAVPAHRSLYLVLGLLPAATQDEVKAAWKRKAFQLHPDRNQHDPDATEKLKELNNAYDTLKDPIRRRAYDTYGPSWRRYVRASTWNNRRRRDPAKRSSRSSTT